MGVLYDDLEVGQEIRFGGPGSGQWKEIVAIQGNWIYLDGEGLDMVRNLKVPRWGLLSNLYTWNSFNIITDLGEPILTNRLDTIDGDYRGLS